MKQNPLEQLERLSDEIRDEEISFLINGMADAILHEEDRQKERENPREATEREKCASILLRSMRIHLRLDLIRQGYSSCIREVRKDWDKIIDCLKFMECEWDVTNELLGDAVDIILLLGPGRRRELLRLLDFSTRLKIKQRKPLRYPIVDCAVQMANYCVRTKRTNEMLRIAGNLIALSEARNAAEPEKHRAIVLNGLYYIVDCDHELTVRVCDAQRRYYKGIENSGACRFYWFYAAAHVNLGNEETAVPLLKYCYDLCMKVEGETSWFGVRSGILYQYRKLDTDAAEKAEAYLWDAVKKIESGFYHNMDGTADYIAATTRYVLLNRHMQERTLNGLLPEIQRLWDYCASNEQTNTNPEMTVRRAENLLAAYYLDAGYYLQALEHSQNALHSEPPNGLPKKPTDIFIYTNLLLIYINLNDSEQIVHYVQKLRDLYDEYADDEYLLTRVGTLLNTAEKRFEFEEDKDDPDGTALDASRRQIFDFYQTIRDHDVETSESDMANTSFAQWMLTLCSDILDSMTADREELLRIREIVCYFKDRPDTYKFSAVQKCTLYVFMAQIEWQLGSGKALDRLQECLVYADSMDASSEGWISIRRFAALLYYIYRLPERSRAMLDDAFSGITSAWQKATSYLNDHRVCQLMVFIQIQFGICFSMLRACAPAEVCYERVLQYKNLPALVGRERNRLLRLAPVDEQLKNQIFAMQDRLAAAEMNDSLNGTNSTKAIAQELERLEARFAAEFPQNLCFTDISFRRVCEKLPDRAAIVEYFFTLDADNMTDRSDTGDSMKLDIFITAKRNGIAHLEYLKLEGGERIMEQAEAFNRILQDAADPSTAGEKARLRKELYHKLLAPVLPFLDGITDLYLAPDDALCNVPYEILYADDSGLLQDRFKVCRLVCGRDLLFYDDAPSGGSYFILGDPDYESERGEIADSHVRGAKISLEPVDDLPFSGIEAARIGRHCRSRIYSGHAATKYALQDALPCRVIHLATHGLFDEEMETDSLYSSHLVFAGYNKWVQNKTESEYCGNGVLTADEISRMDLKKTELVVLSACQSGLGDTSYGSVRGLLSAFSAAGARWIVSHMWKANDFATAILMDAFYDALQNKGYNVPDALQYAKQYLKNVTIDILSRNGWLDLPDNGRFTKSAIKEAKDMQNWPQNDKPFEDEYFWGGFTVHKSR